MAATSATQAHRGTTKETKSAGVEAAGTVNRLPLSRSAACQRISPSKRLLRLLPEVSPPGPRAEVPGRTSAEMTAILAGLLPSEVPTLPQVARRHRSER